MRNLETIRFYSLDVATIDRVVKMNHTSTFRLRVDLINLVSMASSRSPCHTHTYDGQLREKWLQMRPMLMETYHPECLSFDETIKQIEDWLNKKYFNVKRIGRARRSIRILTEQRRRNLDSRNDIDVEELLPMIWKKIENQEDLHDLFYEQFCDITGGSCAQGRSTRLFQFLFLFDSMFPTTNSDETASTQQQPVTDENTSNLNELTERLSIEETTSESVEDQKTNEIV